MYLFWQMSEERHDADSDSDRDSGNDEPTENVPENGAAAEKGIGGANRPEKSPENESDSGRVGPDAEEENRNFLPSRRSESESRDPAFLAGHHHEERSQCRHHQNHHDAVRGRDDQPTDPDNDSDLVQNFPPEVLMAIFSFLVKQI